MAQTFETSGSVTMVLGVPCGKVDLVADQSSQTTVEVVPLRDDEASRIAADETRVDLRREGDDSTITVEVPRPWGYLLFGDDPQVHVIVHTREATNVRMSGAAADFEGRGVLGWLDVTTASGDVAADEVRQAKVKAASGDVRCNRITGEASIRTASGDIALDELGGPTRIHSASGDVTVGRDHSDLKIQTASGDQRIEAVSRGRATLRSASGNLTVGVARGSTVWIDAKSMSGETTSELEVGESPPGADQPHLELRATTMSGDIRIMRADERSEEAVSARRA